MFICNKSGIFWHIFRFRNFEAKINVPFLMFQHCLAVCLRQNISSTERSIISLFGWLEMLILFNLTETLDSAEEWVCK